MRSKEPGLQSTCNYKMCSNWRVLALFGFAASVCVKSSPQLAIFYNGDTLDAEAPLTVEAANGTNFLLTCRVVDAVTRNCLDDTVRWSKRKEKRNTPNRTRPRWNSLQVSNLDFAPVTTEDEGQYSCASHKHRLLKNVHIVVRVEFPVKMNRSKRSDNHGVSFTDADTASQLHQSYNFEGPDYTAMLAKIFFIIIAIIVVCLFTWAIVKCCHNNADTAYSRSRPRPRPANNNRPRTNTGPAANRTRTRNQHLLDLPPAYDASIANSRASSVHSFYDANEGKSADDAEGCALPPTYEEALIYTAVYSPPAYELHCTDTQQ